MNRHIVWILMRPRCLPSLEHCPTFSSISAATGRQLKQSVNVRHSLRHIIIQQHSIRSGLHPSPRYQMCAARQICCMHATTMQQGIVAVPAVLTWQAGDAALCLPGTRLMLYRRLHSS